MASWGIELELHGIMVAMHIYYVDLELKLLGHTDYTHYRINIGPIHIGPIHIGSTQIGPGQLEESHGLKSLTKDIANFLSKNVPRNRDLASDINFEQIIENFIKDQKEIFDLYGCKINLGGPPFIEPINIYEKRIQDHFIFSIDHDSDGNVIPELNSNPFGLRPGGFNEEQLSERDAIAFIQNVYHYVILFYQYLPLTRNVQMYLPTLSKISKLFNIEPNSLSIVASGKMDLISNPKWSFIAPQLNTIVDLTHFSVRPQKDSPDPLKDLLSLSKLGHNWLPREFGLINYEITILNFSRAIIEKMNEGLGRVPHVSDPWIRGAIGLAIWSVLSLCIGGRALQKSSQKNLWILMPKIDVTDFLTSAFEANQSLPPPANNYYIELIMNFIPAFHIVFDLVNRDGPFMRALNNSVIYNTRSLIQYRLQKWYAAPLPSYCPNLVPNDINTIKQLIMATLICGVSKMMEKVRIVDYARKELHLSNANLIDSSRFMREIFGIPKKLSIKDRGGYGRPKFELRALPHIFVPRHAPPAEPDYSKYVAILNAVARPAVLVPLPPDVPVEQQHRIFPAASVDSKRSGSLYGGEIAPDERKEYHSIWFPGIPGYEHGRRSAADVHKWLEEIGQQDIRDKEKPH